MRIRSTATIGLVGIFIFWVYGCSVGQHSVSKLAALYENGFVGLSLPDKSKIKSKGLSSKKIPVSFNTIMNSMIIVAMQYAPLIHAELEQGVLVAPPYALYAEIENGSTVYAYFMLELYKNPYDQSKDSVLLRSDDINYYLSALLSQIETQALSQERIQAGGKWSNIFNLK